MIRVTDDLSLKCFDKVNDIWFIDEVNGNSKSDMIHDIDDRLMLSRSTTELELSNAYLVVYKDNIVGYVYLTTANKNKFYFEYLLLKEYRGKGLGGYILDSVTDMVCMNNPHVLECRVNIDKSNLASMKAATNNYFVIDEDTAYQDRIDFIKINPYYIRPNKKQSK